MRFKTGDNRSHKLDRNPSAVVGDQVHTSLGVRFRFQDLKPGDVRKKTEDKIAPSQVFARRGRDNERSGGQQREVGMRHLVGRAVVHVHDKRLFVRAANHLAKLSGIHRG